MKFVKIMSVMVVALLAAVTVSAHERGAPKDVGKEAPYVCENFVAPDVISVAIDLPAVTQVYEPGIITVITASDNSWLESNADYSDKCNLVRYQRSDAEIQNDYTPLKYRRSNINIKNYHKIFAATTAMPGQNGELPGPVKPIPRE